MWGMTANVWLAQQIYDIRKYEVYNIRKPVFED